MLGQTRDHWPQGQVGYVLAQTLAIVKSLMSRPGNPKKLTSIGFSFCKIHDRLHYTDRFHNSVAIGRILCFALQCNNSYPTRQICWYDWD